MSEAKPTGLAIMEARTDAALEVNRIERAIEARATSPEVSLLNDMAQLEIFGSAGRTYTDPETGAVIATPERPIMGKLDDIKKNPKYGKTQADRDASAEEYSSDVENLLGEGYELCQVKMIMDMRESDIEGRATRTAKLIAGGLGAVEADNKARAEYEKKDATRTRLIKEGGAFTVDDYEKVRKGESLYPVIPLAKEVEEHKPADKVTDEPKKGPEKTPSSPKEVRRNARDTYLKELDILKSLNSGSPQDVELARKRVSDALYELAESTGSWTQSQIDKELERVKQVHGFDLRKSETTATTKEGHKVTEGEDTLKTEIEPKTPEEKLDYIRNYLRSRLTVIKVNHGITPMQFFTHGGSEAQIVLRQIRENIDPEGTKKPDEVRAEMLSFIEDVLSPFVAEQQGEHQSKEQWYRKLGRSLVDGWRRGRAKVTTSAANVRLQNGGEDLSSGSRHEDELAPNLRETNYRTKVTVDEKGNVTNVKLHKDIVDDRNGEIVGREEIPRPPAETEFKRGQEFRDIKLSDGTHNLYISRMTVSTEDGTEIVYFSTEPGGPEKYATNADNVRLWVSQQKKALQPKPEVSAAA